jgi:hypothetical protein
MRTVFAVVLITILLACAGKAMDVGSNSGRDSGAPGSNGSLDSGGPVGTMAGSSAIPSSFSLTEVDIALAKCSQPHGSVDAYSTVAGLKSRLVGAWLSCPGNFTQAPSRSWAADGTWHRLVSADGQDPGSSSGYSYVIGLVEGQGLQDVGTYVVENEAGTECTVGDCEVTARRADGATDSYGVAFEMAPRRMLVSQMYWYVPLGE